MKMKTIVGLIIIAAMLSGVMVGCQAAPEEVIYQQVLVEPMTVSIPSDWERPEEYGEMMEETTRGIPPEQRQAIQVDIYGVPKSEDVVLFIMPMDMKQLYELQGLPWRGWETELEAGGMTKEDFAIMTSSGFIGEIEELTRTMHHQLTIHGNEAWESQFTGKSEGEPGRVSLLCIFAEDDLGILMMFGDEAAWAKFEGTWGKIRDSAELPPEA